MGNVEAMKPEDAKRGIDSLRPDLWDGQRWDYDEEQELAKWLEILERRKERGNRNLSGYCKAKPREFPVKRLWFLQQLDKWLTAADSWAGRKAAKQREAKKREHPSPGQPNEEESEPKRLGEAIDIRALVEGLAREVKEHRFSWER